MEPSSWQKLTLRVLSRETRWRTGYEGVVEGWGGECCCRPTGPSVAFPHGLSGFYLWLHYSFNCPSHLRLFSWESVDNLARWQRDNHQHKKAPFWRRQRRGTSKCCLFRLPVQAQSQAQANDSLTIPPLLPFTTRQL